MGTREVITITNDGGASVQDKGSLLLKAIESEGRQMWYEDVLGHDDNPQTPIVFANK